MVVLSSFFCLLSFFGSFFYAYKLGSRGVCVYSCINIFFAFIVSLVSFAFSLNGLVVHIKVFKWLSVGDLIINCSFIFDSLCNSVLIVVTGVSFLIHVYSIIYMKADPYISRFMAFLSLFTFFMVVLVSADNFLILFFAWEGVGLCSYLLISFWFTRIAAVKAALEAVAFNRIGDFGLLLAVFFVFVFFRTLDFSIIFSIIPHVYERTFLQIFGYDLLFVDIISLCIFLGVIAKSAQLGLHAWLPDAMEGPTPVSALLHSSTMVVAGVFVLLRCSHVFEFSFFSLSCIAFVGSVTSFFAASVGLVQHDLKKVIAYSTCSQLGYMVFACGLSCYQLSFFHLFNHAFFKSLLFLSAGAVIHALGDEQDMRRMGGLLNILPFVYSVMFIASLSLAGFPFLSGYYSKDAILESCFSSTNPIGLFCGFLGSASAFLTSFYSFRLLYLTFLSDTRMGFRQMYFAHEPPFLMAVPLLLLAVLSIFSGYLFRDMFIGAGTDFWVSSFLNLPFRTNLPFYEFVPLKFRLLPVLSSLLGLFIAYILYTMYYVVIAQFVLVETNFYSFFSKKWYFDFSFLKIFRNVLKAAYDVPLKNIDQGWLQFFGPTGLKSFFTSFSKLIFTVQSGYLFHYVWWMIFGTFGIFFLYSSVSEPALLGLFIHNLLALIIVLSFFFLGKEE